MKQKAFLGVFFKDESHAFGCAGGKTRATGRKFVVLKAKDGFLVVSERQAQDAKIVLTSVKKNDIMDSVSIK